MTEKYYSVKEIAHMEQVSSSLVYNWIRLGFIQVERLPTINGKGNIRIKEVEYNNFKEIFKK